MAGQKPGGYHFLSGKSKLWKDAIDAESLDEYRKKFDSIEKNIKEAEKILSWAPDGSLDGKVSVSQEFMRLFGLK